MKFGSIRLTAETTEAWLDQHLMARQTRYDVDSESAGERQWVTLADLLDDDARMIRDVHARVMVEDGASAAAATKWVAS